MISDPSDTGIEHFRSNLVADETRRPEFLVGSNEVQTVCYNKMGTRVNLPHTAVRGHQIRTQNWLDFKVML